MATPTSLAAFEEWRGLVVRSVTPAADGVLAIRLGSPDGAMLPSWTPGAHIAVRVNSRIERHYSLCGEPDDGVWRIAVLLEEAGAGGSRWLHAHLREGMVLETRGPWNHFVLQEASRYFFVAGGIGITPLLPMLRQVAREGRPWKLLYGGRRRASMAFLDEFPAATPQDELAVRPQEECGMLELGPFLANLPAGAAVYACGPEGLLKALEAMAGEWPRGTLHLERFKPIERAHAPDGAFELVLARSGITVQVASGETMVEAAERAGVYLRTSCGEGVCGTCATDVLEGIPDHRDSFLFGAERDSNRTVAPCCSRSCTPRIVIDA